MITENLPTLKIHKLTKEQYKRELANGNIDETALYLTPEEEIDFSVYATVEQMNSKADANHTHTIDDVTDLQTTLDTMSNDISGKANSSHTHDDRYYTESEVDTKISGVNSTISTHTGNTTVHITSGERTNWNSAYSHSTSTHAPSNAERNIIVGVQKNGTDLTVDSSTRKVNITVPTTAAEIGAATTTHNHDSAYDSKGSAAGALAEAKEYTNTKTSGMATTTVVDSKISSHNTSTTAHSDIRDLISALSTKVNNFLDVDDTTTDQLSEVLELINNNKGTLESLTSSKVNVSDIVDNLTTASTSKVLSANQGVVLKGLIDSLQEAVNGKADSSHIHAPATTTSDGFMRATDKVKIDRFTYDESIPKLTIDGGASQIYLNDDCVEVNAAGGTIFNDDVEFYNAVTFTSRPVCDDGTMAVTSDIPDYITTGANSGTTLGTCATAEGYQTEASGDYAHAEGMWTSAKGLYSHAGGYCTIANNYQYVVGKFNADTTAPTSLSDTTASAGLFIVGIGQGMASRSNGFRVNPAGKVYGTGTFGTSGADYAEYFEWLDGNPNNEDRRGHFVTLEGDKIRYATTNDDYILGVVSADPSVAGDVYSEDWHNRYLKDIFGSKIVDVVEVEETANEDGEIIPAHTERRWVLNPDYDPDLKYTSREERPEWAAIGIVGKLVVVDDGTCQVNGYCYPNVNGIAAASQEKTNYRVMERLDDTHIRIFIR